ncbi:MAG: hypothetical protein FWC78_06600 [Defluviitaleaceae bacterium]|nr:hypothetical protein [Defluviitaleaceae bacterium]
MRNGLARAAPETLKQGVSGIFAATGETDFELFHKTSSEITFFNFGKITFQSFASFEIAFFAISEELYYNLATQNEGGAACN